MAKKPEKIVSFEKQTRNEYVKNVFTEVFVAGILICVLRGILYFPTSFISSQLSGGGWQYYMKTLITALLGAVGLGLPIYLYGLAVDSPLSAAFKKKTVPGKGKLPVYFIAGTLAAVSASLILLRLSFMLMSAMEESGYVFSVTPPDTGEGLSQNLFFIAVYSVIPALFCEPLYRGVIMNRTLKDSYALSVIIPALIFAANHPTLPQMPYMFVTGLIFGWLYLKSGCIWVSIVAHTAVNAVISALFVFSGETFTALDTSLVIIAAAVLLFSAAVLLVFSGFSRKHDDTDRPFSAAEAFRAVFLTFGIYVLTFTVLIQLGEWHIDNPDFRVPGFSDRDDEYRKEHPELYDLGDD